MKFKSLTIYIQQHKQITSEKYAFKTFLKNRSGTFCLEHILKLATVTYWHKQLNFSHYHKRLKV